MSKDDHLSAAETQQWNEASRMINAGQYASAVKLLDKLVENNRAVPKLHAHRGYALYQLGRYAEAVRSFDRAIALTPNAKNTLFLRGRCHEELEEFARAIDDYRRVIALAPATADAYAQMGLLPRESWAARRSQSCV